MQYLYIFLYISVPEMVQVYLFVLLLICLFVILLPTQCLLFFNDFMHEIQMQRNENSGCTTWPKTFLKLAFLCV